MRHGTLFFSLLLLFHVSMLLCLPIFSVRAETVKITTWNVEWLLSPTDITRFHLPDNVSFKNSDDLHKLSHYIQRLNSDILALQEVGSIEAAKQILSPNDYDFLITDDPVAQHPLLAIRKSLSYQIRKNPDLTALALSNSHHPLRSGLDVTLYKNGYSLRILVVHLKAHCQEYLLETAKPACILLKQQYAILQAWIHQRLNEKQPFLILGDFNHIFSTTENFLGQHLSDLTLPTLGFATPCWGGNYFIDSFILDKQTGQKLQKDSLKVMTFNENILEARKHLSDHCPVSITLSLP